LWVGLGPLDPQDVRQIVVEYLREYCKELDEEHIAAICRTDQARHPLYLLVMLNELRMLGGERLNELVPLLLGELRERFPDVVALFDRVLERLEAFGPDVVRLWCGYVWLARTGLASGELRELLARELGPEGAAASSRVERGIRGYLLRRGHQWDFFHSQLRLA